MKFMTRFLIAFICSVLAIIPTIISRPGKMTGIIIFTFVAFAEIFIISSLFNIKNAKHRIGSLCIVILLFLYKFHSNYFTLHDVLSKSIIMSLVTPCIFAAVLRGASLLKEKNSQSSPLEGEKA